MSDISDEMRNELLNKILPKIKNESLRKSIEKKLENYVDDARCILNASEKIRSKYLMFVAENFWCPNCFCKLPKEREGDEEMEIMKFSSCCSTSAHFIMHFVETSKKYLKMMERVILAIKPLIDEESFEKILDVYSNFHFPDAGKNMQKSMLNGLYLVMSEIGNALSDPMFGDVVSLIDELKKAYNKNDVDEIVKVQAEVHKRISEITSKRLSEMVA